MNEIQPKAVKTSQAKRSRRGRLSATISKVAETSKKEVAEDLSQQVEQQVTIGTDLKKFKATSNKEVAKWLVDHPYIQTALAGVGFTIVSPRKAYRLAREIAEKTLSRQLDR